LPSGLTRVCAQWSSTDDSNEETKVHQQKVKVAYLAAESTIDEEDENLANLSGTLGDPVRIQYFITVLQRSLTGM
jgi:hypothetical protein